MAPKTYAWISLWFVLTAPLMYWDAGYCLMRPRSMRDGDLRWFWKLYEMYEQVDYVYGVKAYEDGQGFSNAAAILNIVETTFNVAYLYLAHIAPSDLAPLAGYTGAAMTFSKTLLYVSQEYFCGWCSIGHNEPHVALFYWIMPNIVWLTSCALIMRRLGNDIASSLRKDKTIKCQ
ncbi:hypothetical protein BD779DRAFT_1618635 [Infundibulicybe gibba]|nr:hypothetical protein BD779DRAFT_1618635 [Infundibulicybe gibba]